MQSSIRCGRPGREGKGHETQNRHRTTRRRARFVGTPNTHVDHPEITNEDSNTWEIERERKTLGLDKGKKGKGTAQ